MYDYNLLENRDVLCIDQKSFFASVSCREKGLDPMKTKLAVVADTKRQGSVVLAATPPLKKLGIKTGSRLFEIPHRNDIYIINPSMRKYLNVSVQISKIALQYVPPEDLHQYSIDEFFMDVTNSYHRFNTTLHSFCERLIKEIYDETKITCAIGIGSNMLLSKIALDNEAKHQPSMIAEWRYHDVPTKLWPIEPLREFWGINRRTEAKLNKRGIFTMGQLAKYPHQYLKRDFGVIGVDLHLHANGIDQSLVREKYKVNNPSICKSQILMRDYEYEESKIVMRELIEDAASRLRARNQFAKTIHFSMGYKDGGGVHKQYTIPEGTNLDEEIFQIIEKHADKMCDKSALYRTLSVSLTQFSNDTERQLNLFSDEFQRRRDEKLAKTIDQLQFKYGKGIISKAISYTDAGTKHNRLGLMAGHKM
ncbi:Y-family DNA polymerase [Staphylococcus massiliensis]|uniref:ImpB/MucB/SamB family protein n=1 Tax=Staphylococcus massiliensis S46 TaxID=1229783 RepID=K9AWY9_9STAP|nr:Y-family DNA polymerase [Staphylococcus massiliensis]EKU47087.1 ImpB/MucB/SamB family protein [Staphylococcus massiliensis S46]MCG3398621.1 Y-family DNA polymerase [Staphylococcus massiliensis]MCG3401184.1 Y-family DNA polymerase [Staphylococcus massiliensis]MCG3412322.1 Y-family DNA polymerase [Staphylococcus massiliensis]PNZ98523.1 DNA repair protein [Staphylococcus massiliensis CCUG 55927]